MADRVLTIEDCFKKMKAAKNFEEYSKWSFCLNNIIEYQIETERRIRKVMIKNFGFRPGIDKLIIK